MKTILFRIYTILTLSLLSISVLASESENTYEYQKGEKVHYAWDYSGVTDRPGEIAAHRSNDSYIIRLDESLNGKQYLVDSTVDHIFSTKKCTTHTDDGSQLCAGSVAISFSYAVDVTVVAVNNYAGTVLVDDQGTLRILGAQYLIATETIED